jgi:type VI secretion system secreted protein VgrG
MATYTQSERPLEITTPLGKDVLLLTKFKGHETISQLFHFELEMHAEISSVVKFEKILGQAVTIRMDLTNGEKRYWNGIVSKFSQAGRNDRGFGKFRAEIVPALWILSKKVRSRIFQHLSVPEILRQVLTGFEISFRLIGAYPPRDYCVQYRESDFHFASRLMEEEGISYFFEHKQDTHTMIVTDRLNLVVDGQNSAIYDDDEGSVATDMRVTNWEKIQELRSGEYTFWDHSFELPGNHLETKKTLTQQVEIGTVSHKLRVGVNDDWEDYDYPGGYAQRFDGIDSSGTPQPTGIRHIFEDRDRAIQIRMQREECASIDIHGESYCGNFSAGHKFTLMRHFDADGEYLLTRVEHEGRLEDHQSGATTAFTYTNRFRCLPSSVNFRPQALLSKPVIAGVQTATVTGPPGEEIFVDKYGRVKVQFHWDREGKLDASSSCWLRVSQFWAGKKWGAFFWPRIGNEVVVVFEEGDPDQPLVIGSVYNAENMPWFELPICKDFGGFKSVSLRGSAHEHYNGVILVDRKGQEHLAMHSERHMIVNAEFDQMVHTGRHHGQRVPGHKTVTVGGLPGSGSGGGPDRDLWPNPPVQSIAGLNTAVVYGTNFQTATPMAFQMALGSNLQMCLNPSALTNLLGDCPMPPLDQRMAQLIGGGIGGNMQFTLGTSANFVIGQSYDINIGPRRIVVDVHDQAIVNIPLKHLAWILAALAVAFEIVYAIIGIKDLTDSGDDARAVMICIYVPVTQVLLTAMLANQELNNMGLRKFKSGYNGSYATDDISAQGFAKIADSDSYADSEATGVAILTMVGVVTALTAPPILAAVGEHGLDVGHAQQGD